MSEQIKKVPQGRLTRFRQLASMGARVGADMVRARLAKDDAEAQEGLARQAAERVVATLGTMKGLALKVGQSMAMAAEEMPPDAHALMAKMFSQAPTLPFADIAQVIEAQLGQPLDAVFAHVDEKPLAAASLAQVHGATLRDGSAVVVKVQYPEVAQALRDDLRNVGTLAQLSRLGGAMMDGRVYVDEVTREFTNELDYTREAAWMETYRQATANIEGLVVPRNYREYTRPGMLVLERLQGQTLQAYCSNVTEHPHAERVKLAELLIQAVALPMAQHRVVYGDTHPGNFIVLPDGRLGVLDYGCLREVSEAYVNGMKNSLRAVLSEDFLPLAGHLRSAGFTVDISDEQAAEILPDMIQVSTGFLTKPYDWTVDTRAEKLKALRSLPPTLFMRLRPPPESMLSGRAFSGLTYNLRRLQVTADFTPLARRLVA